MSSDDKEEVEFLTGRIPLLMEVLTKYRGSRYKSIKAKFTDDATFTHIRTEVIRFTRKKLELLSPSSQNISLLTYVYNDKQGITVNDNLNLHADFSRT